MSLQSGGFELRTKTGHPGRYSPEFVQRRILRTRGQVALSHGVVAPSTPSVRTTAALVALLGLTALLQISRLQTPLLEGAAGKQAHMGMVAKNFARGYSSFTRPRVDDVGPPGYFVKEMPVLPMVTAVLAGASTAPIDSVGRGLGLAAWLLAVAVFFRIVQRVRGDGVGLVAAAWMAWSPLALAYAPAFQNDQATVAASLLAFLALARWREAPTPSRALATAPLILATLLLKPHAALWLAPAAAVFVFAGSKGGRAERRACAVMVLVGTLAAAAALPWYLHAASIHRAFPVAGATVPEGWVDVGLLADPYLWQELARQIGQMVFTPGGLVLAGVGLVARRKQLRTSEWALLAWGAGVLVQDLVFTTRFFDELSHGTEYYQLPMLAPAALLIAGGCAAVLENMAGRGCGRLRQLAGAAGLATLLLVPSARAARAAIEQPARYTRLLADCARVRAATDPSGAFVVFADRGGTVLYYCERSGTTFTLAGGQTKTRGHQGQAAGGEHLTRTLTAARYVYFPFPELLLDEGLLSHFREHWRAMSLGEPELLLFEKKRQAAR